MWQRLYLRWWFQTTILISNPSTIQVEFCVSTSLEIAIRSMEKDHRGFFVGIPYDPIICRLIFSSRLCLMLKHAVQPRFLCQDSSLISLIHKVMRLSCVMWCDLDPQTCVVVVYQKRMTCCFTSCCSTSQLNNKFWRAICTQNKIRWKDTIRNKFEV